MSGHSADPELEENPDAGEEADEAVASADEHLSDLPDGAGCTEIWEHLSEGRGEAD